VLVLPQPHKTAIDKEALHLLGMVRQRMILKNAKYTADTANTENTADTANTENTADTANTEHTADTNQT
jgi:hypothetical protein